MQLFLFQDKKQKPNSKLIESLKWKKLPKKELIE